MKLGGYALDWDPDNQPAIVPEKRSSFVKTWESVAYFSWGATIVGKEITIEWDWMKEAQFSSIQALHIADEAVLWDLDAAGKNNYMVEITFFDGKLFDTVGYGKAYRKDVKLRLLLLSETSAGTS